jgi:hypothetical protein
LPAACSKCVPLLNNIRQRLQDKRGKSANTGGVPAKNVASGAGLGEVDEKG